MFYVISPPERTEWRLDQDVFVRSLLSDWPGITIHPPEPDSPTRSVVWSMEDPEGGSKWLEGSLDREGQAHYLRGDLGLSAEFAQWLRREVDRKQPLVFSDEAFTHVISLTAEGSAAAIVDAYAVM